jgi:hypothetical protein
MEKYEPTFPDFSEDNVSMKPVVSVWFVEGLQEPPWSLAFKLALEFNPEDEDNRFFQNVDNILPSYQVLHSTKQKPFHSAIINCTSYTNYLPRNLYACLCSEEGLTKERAIETIIIFL